MARKSKPIKRLFVDAWEYLKESVNYITFAISIFLASAIFGYIFNADFTFLNELLRSISERVEGKGTIELIWFIFQNNLTSAFLATVLGVFLGVFPVVNAMTNGLLLGYVYARASAIAGFEVILLLIPHGIFELPAVFIAIGLGIKLGMFIFVKGDKTEEFKRRFWNSMKVFFAFVLPLLIIAAIIEGILINIG